MAHGTTSSRDRCHVSTCSRDRCHTTTARREAPRQQHFVELAKQVPHQQKLAKPEIREIGAMSATARGTTSSRAPRLCHVKKRNTSFLSSRRPYCETRISSHACCAESNHDPSRKLWWTRRSKDAWVSCIIVFNPVIVRRNFSDCH